IFAAQGGWQVGDVPGEDLARPGGRESAWAGRGRARGGAVTLHAVLLQDAVERRLGGVVDAAIGEEGDDLLRRQIAVFGGVDEPQDPLLLRRRELVVWGAGGPAALVFAAARGGALGPPALHCADCQAEQFAGSLEPGAGCDGLVDEPQGHRSLVGSVSSSSSPQIAAAFFFSTSSAAASARALSLRLNSRSSSR